MQTLPIMECSLCGKETANPVRCAVCDAALCNRMPLCESNDIMTHYAVAGHYSFNFPEIGVPKCSVCNESDILKLYYNEEHVFFCDEHQAALCSKFVIDRPLLTRIVDKDDYKHFREVVCQHRLQQADQDILIIPNCFPQSTTDARWAGGLPYLYKQLRPHIDSGRVKYENGEFHSTEYSLQMHINAYRKSLFHSNFFSRVLESEIRTAELEAVYRREALNPKLVYVIETQENPTIIVTWPQARKISGYLLKSGNVMFMNACRGDICLEFSGPIKVGKGYFVISATRFPLYEDLREFIANINEFKITLYSNLQSVMLIREMDSVKAISQQRGYLFDMLMGLYYEQDMTCDDDRYLEIEDADYAIKQLEQQIETMKLNGARVYQPNESQRQAIRRALIRPLSLIQGCPGGGKTYACALLVRAMLILHPNDRILCCAGSNTAADNIALALLQVGIAPLRVYARTKEQCEGYGAVYLTEYALQNQVAKRTGRQAASEKRYQKIVGRQCTSFKSDTEIYIEDEILARAKVVVCTCATAAFKRIGKQTFAATIIDEAAHIIEPEALLPLAVTTSQFILVGDQKQLGPIVRSRVAAKAGLYRSLFQRLISLEIHPLRLTYQYRMHPVLMEFPNEHFYRGSLESMVTEQDRYIVPQYANAARNALTDLLRRCPSVFWAVQGAEHCGRGQSFKNDVEIRAIRLLVEFFVTELGIQQRNIGIITPYALQQEQLAEQLIYFEELEVNSVDGFQGREKDVILFSCVRSNEEQRMGFLTDWRRLNVAITRARKAIVYVGNAIHLAAQPGHWRDLIEWHSQRGALCQGAQPEEFQPLTLQLADPEIVEN